MCERNERRLTFEFFVVRLGSETGHGVAIAPKVPVMGLQVVFERQAVEFFAEQVQELFLLGCQLWQAL